MRLLIFMLSIFLVSGIQAQLEVSLGGMQWKCYAEGKDLIMELQAPTDGWVGVGFNHKNDIVHSDLLLFQIVDSKAKSTDLYVKGAGNPIKDEVLGGSHDIEIIEYREGTKDTFIKFRRPWKRNDVYDYPFKNGESFWLILAYSTHDEFEHHSRMRKHKELIFNVN